MTPQSTLELSVHSWRVQSPQSRFLIDTATGNDKPRPFSPMFDRLNSPWMENFLATGLRPEDIDYVLHTHLHIDHVGWNIRREGTQWVHTFPNARWVIAQEEMLAGQVGILFALPSPDNRGDSITAIYRRLSSAND
ncbi:MBL fold metallo-hydrolase [Erwinia tracheiphila]|uniref:MBL fold metallo-hydrolase n=1 Tax=Erwinia tracheiphila TaxID=65700 RepID=A0A345CY97_9GAMM|nr:MBL fold metallo-hydrolase [Erwinia tracheiphila]AXF78414.1 MBL fold metallo-hydrolase [Erwinia tracheiphila]EOS95807.1 beta-lactamase [Erwinia tracheiphila PSU-1]UIA82855.1 MBL fold metallo-hydrolase [Erwinia tracheiphila]UIA88867.1 MBL fold metallo-hydrolase [Erwinia tracheiphila]UIA91442.1 MBL fold metallo-hydrolase [Erwinia tracheiphila]